MCLNVGSPCWSAAVRCRDEQGTTCGQHQPIMGSIQSSTAWKRHGFKCRTFKVFTSNDNQCYLVSIHYMYRKYFWRCILDFVILNVMQCIYWISWYLRWSFYNHNKFSYKFTSAITTTYNTLFTYIEYSLNRIGFGMLSNSVALGSIVVSDIGNNNIYNMKYLLLKLWAPSTPQLLTFYLFFLMIWATSSNIGQVQQAFFLSDLGYKLEQALARRNKRSFYLI